MVKKKLAFVFGVFCATVLLMAVQKPVFLAYYAADAAQASAGEWLGVVWHGLTLDSTVAGYVTALPLLLTLASLWVRLPERIWRRVLNVYFVLIAVLTAAIFAVDVELYRHWGFRLDSTVLIYLADPKEAMASVDFWLGVRQTLLAAAYVALMIWTYRRVVGLFDGEPLRRRAALPWTFGLLLLAGCDFLAVNYFAEHEAFERLRPAYYVLSDPQFFRASAQRDRVAALYRTLARKVTWPMTLYVQYYNPERFDYRAALPNGRIRIVPFHTQPYRGFRRLEFWLYRHGLGSANFGTVIQHGEYVGLLLGYRTLHLYGVDHTLTEGLTVDRRNRLCRIDRHFYDDGRPAEAHPMYVNATCPPVPYTMASYMAELAELFRGHEVLRDYAASLGARIVNHTRTSMIDAYERAADDRPST